jgi:hypothetical protein
VRHSKFQWRKIEGRLRQSKKPYKLETNGAKRAIHCAHGAMTSCFQLKLYGFGGEWSEFHHNKRRG